MKPILASGASMRTGRMILVADDEPHITYMLTRKLEAIGFRVTVADNGRAALKLAVERVPDLIITDNQMPVLNGFDMCVSLRAELGPARIPVIMLTARGHQLNGEDVRRAGIAVLLPKPFSIKEVLAHVQRLLPETEDDASAATGGIAA